jgi:drug/metabolite transporter (DMT)-like permease
MWHIHWIVRTGIAPRTWAILALLAANVIWGTTFVATKAILDRVPPITVATGRFAIALLVLLLLLAASKRRPILSRTTAVMGFVGILLVYVCQNVGLSYTGAANGALIHGGIPVFTMFIAAPLLGERLSRGRLAGLVLSLMGVTMVVLRDAREQLGVSVIGDGLVLLSALGLATYLVLGRRVFGGERQLELVAGVTVFGLLFLLPVTGMELATKGMEGLTQADVLGLLYLGAVASALAFMFWAYGLRHLEAGQAAVFANLNPLIGVIAAAIVLHEAISWIQLAGGLLILGGVWLVTRPVMGTLSP